MSTGDFAAELRQSVQDHIALIHTAASAAKARIGQSIPVAGDVAPSSPAIEPAMPLYDDERPRAAGPAVNFFAEDPSFASALDGPAEPLPEGAISFEDDFGSNVDDEGIPVWEDAP